MDLLKIKDQLEVDLEKAVVSSTTLFGRFRFLEEKSKATGAYFDPRYIPFYYHLGKYLSPRNLLHAGFGLGFQSGVFLMKCASVERIFAFEDPRGEFYSPRLGTKNIRDRFKGDFNLAVGSIHDAAEGIQAAEWDLIIITEMTSYDEHRVYFDTLWQNLAYGGILVVDHLSHETNKKALEDFTKIVNRQPVLIQTRYGVALVNK